MSPITLILIYCVFTLLASLLGGWLPTLIHLTHTRKQIMMSLVSGVMLGVALLHMLPQSLEHLPSISYVGGSMLCGVLVMFFLLRVFHVHSHDTPHLHENSHEAELHDHDHDHDHETGVHDHAKKHGFSWVVLFVGLTIHSLLDGVAMAASVAAEAGHDEPIMSMTGLGTFLAVFLHKPLDALAITSLMRAVHCSGGIRTLVNALFALSCPLGAWLFWLCSSQLVDGQFAVVGCALAFSAGFFLCIALSDLLPEVAFHSHDRVKLSMALLIGVALAICIEMSHSHEHKRIIGDHLHRSQDHSEEPH